MSKRLGLVIAILPLLCGFLRAQAFVDKIREPASKAEDHFGGQVLWHDDVLFVAESGTDLAGLVHVFSEQPQGWVEVDAFAPADAQPGMEAGGALAADGDVLVVGSRTGQWTGEPVVGGAWIFVRDRGHTATPLDDRWTELQALEPADAGPPPVYGRSVAVSGDHALVGAPSSSPGHPAAVYVFVRDGNGTSSWLDDVWTQQARLDPSPLTPGSRLGTTVAFMDGGQLALASDPSDKAGANGGLLTWVRDAHGTADPLDDTWVSGPQIEAPAGAALLETFVVNGEQILAEGYHPDPYLSLVSCIDVFERVGDVWSVAQVIDDPQPPLGPFARRLAADGDWMVTGFLGWDFPTGFGSDSMIFQRAGGAWTHVKTLKAPDASARDKFGFAVSARGSRLFLGAPGGPYDDDDPPVDGAVYVMAADAPNGWTSVWEEHADLQLGGWGLLDGAHAVTVRGYDAWESKPALLVVGFSQLDAPLFGHTLLPEPHVLVPTLLGAKGDVEFTGHWPAGLPAGLSVWFQIWMPSPFGWDASHGLQVTQPGA